MDLVIDPIDITGKVPLESFGFITGYTTQIPVMEIRSCARRVVPLARADFDRVESVRSFCEFFLERSRLIYRRFQFHNYVQHQLAHGFVNLLLGQRDEGLERIRAFCQNFGAEFNDRVLSGCISDALSYPID